MKERGLKGVRLIVSDKCLGLYEVIGDSFPETKWQRCIVHWYRNAFTMCPWKHLREVVAMLKAIHAQEKYMPSEPHGEGDIAVELWKKLEPGEK